MYVTIFVCLCFGNVAVVLLVHSNDALMTDNTVVFYFVSQIAFIARRGHGGRVQEFRSGYEGQGHVIQGQRSGCK